MNIYEINVTITRKIKAGYFRRVIPILVAETTATKAKSKIKKVFALDIKNTRGEIKFTFAKPNCIINNR